MIGFSTIDVSTGFVVKVNDRFGARFEFNIYLELSKKLFHLSKTFLYLLILIILNTFNRFTPYNRYVMRCLLMIIANKSIGKCFVIFGSIANKSLKDFNSTLNVELMSSCD